jgi:hypothetical protein
VQANRCDATAARAEAELRAAEGGWWDEWLGWTRAGRDPGQADAEAVG